MDAASISSLFSSHKAELAAIEYLKNELHSDSWNVLEAIPIEGRIPPHYPDLARIHQLICARNAFTVLEFGCGYSTLVMADALRINSMKWRSLTVKPAIRCSTMFQVHSVDSSEKWVESTKRLFPAHLKDYARVNISSVEAGSFQERSCHYYEKLPDVVPDFIYLDGPNPADVIAPRGVGWSNPDRVVMAADILRIEPWLLPGCLVLVDGRSANARFIAKHLYRNWDVHYAEGSDVTAMELQEAPLGRYNRESLKHCLGTRWSEWK